MALSDRVQGRLENWKFLTALTYMEIDATKGIIPTDEEKELIEALALMLGNPGGFTGNLATVVMYALEALNRSNQSKA